MFRRFPALLIALVAAWTAVTPTFAAGADTAELLMWVNGWPQKAVEGIQRVADRFAEEHPAVRAVTVQPVSQSQLVERLTLGVVSDAAPDVITLPAPFIQYTIPGLLQPIDRFLATSRTVRREDYPPLLWNTFAAGGRQYGLPGIEVGPGLVLIYNKELFAAAGLPDSGPDTLQALYEMHRKLTREDPNGGRLLQVGIHPLDSMGSTYFPDIWSTVFAVDWYDPSAQRLHVEAFAPVVDYLKQIYDAPGYSLISGAGIGGWTGGLATGRLAMQINGYWVPGELKSIGSQIPFGYTWMPSSRGDRATAALPWGMGIPASVERADIAFQLMEFFTTPEAAQIMFDAVGWLNGNLRAMRQLSIGNLEVIVPIVAMFEEADRFTAPAPVPIMETVRRQIPGQLTAVWRNEIAGRNALAELQRQLQAELDEVFSGQ
ncbi:MAG TPA: extracellular solute-binding protein [Limnochordia bacterium]